MRFYFSLSPVAVAAATAACLPESWLLPFAIFHFAAYILHRWRWRLCCECFVICGIKNVAILLQTAVSLPLSLSLMVSRSLREAATAAAEAVFECTFSAINQKLLLPLLSASRAYMCGGGAFVCVYM